MKVVGYIQDTARDKMLAVWYYRCFLPLREVNRHDNGIEGHILDAEKVRGMEEAWPDFDVYHWPRMSHGDAEAFVAEVHRRGGKFVIDSDDDLTEDCKLVTGRGQEFKHAIGMADYVTVSTPALAERLAGYTQRPPVVLRNCVDVDWMAETAAKARRVVPGLTIGFSGSPTHWGDWYLPAVPFQRICRDYDVTPVLHGEVPRYLKYVRDDAVHLGGGAYSMYPILLSQFDIILCAVDAEDEFNSGKSAIKALEAMAVGAVPICSRFGPYVELYEAGAPIVLVEENSRDGWYEAMRKVIEGASWLISGPDWVKANRDMCVSGYEQWADFYKEIV